MSVGTVTFDRGHRSYQRAFGEMWLGSAALTPPSVAASSGASDTFTVAGLRLGDSVDSWGYDQAIPDNLTVLVTVSANDTVKVEYINNNLVTQDVTTTASLSPAAVAANTTAEQIFAVAAAAVGDIVVVNKPTAQAGLGIVGARVSSAGNIGITFSNNTAGAITPTAAETYSFALLRPVASTAIQLAAGTLRFLAVRPENSANPV